MPIVTVRIPGMLARFSDGQREHRVAARTPEECVAAVIERYPDLEPHVHTADGSIRAHLQLYLNNRNVDWLDASPVRVREGDTLEIFQAVSGG